MTKVFVYGTLKRDQGRGQVLSGCKFLGHAQTTPSYTLLSFRSFPGINLGGSTSIKGEVYEVDDQTLALLDQIEGFRPHDPESSLFLRHLTKVSLDCADYDDVLCYRINPLRLEEGWLGKAEVIESGEW